ncbi:MAG TPA: multidrug efflux SMR transporter [Planctomycetota bacterium]|nr:multidrug efflux SMR transporter [Planctomycetota bacterium]
MPWLILFLAGLLETCWAVGIKYTAGFTRPVPTAFVAITLAGSMWLLAVAARDLPIGTAYAVWVGIGAFGTALCGILLFGEPVTAARIGFLVLLLVAVLGLRLTAN